MCPAGFSRVTDSKEDKNLDRICGVGKEWKVLKSLKAYNIFRIFDPKRAFLSYNYYEHMAIKCVVVKFLQLDALILWRENEER